MRKNEQNDTQMEENFTLVSRNILSNPNKKKLMLHANKIHLKENDFRLKSGKSYDKKKNNDTKNKEKQNPFLERTR